MQIVGEGIAKPAMKQVKDSGVKKVQTKVIQCDPADEIIKFATDHDIDLIIMGSRGLSRVTWLLMGSFSGYICNLAKVTCVAVK